MLSNLEMSDCYVLLSFMTILLPSHDKTSHFMTQTRAHLGSSWEPHRYSFLSFFLFTQIDPSP